MAESLSQLTLRDLMDAGLHFGHMTKRWNPKMKKYIYGKRNGIHIIDITQSLELLDKALAFAKSLAEDGKGVLFVGTKKQAQEVVKAAAESSGSPYVVNRWLGGTLTNAATIRKSIRRMKQLKRIAEENDGVFSQHKKEDASLRRELEKLEANLTGIAPMDGGPLPSAVYVVDVVREKNAVAEAKRLRIPVIAIVDSNADPDPIDFPIPGNDDSIRAIKLVSDSIASVIKSGAESWERKAAEEARKAEAEKAAKRAAAASIAAEKGDLPAAAEEGERPARAPRKPRAPRAPRGEKAAKADSTAKAAAKVGQTASRAAVAKAAAEAIKARAKAADKPAE